MFRSTYFSQECPTCGRSLQIRVEYLGKRVTCQHCHGQLCAADPANHPVDCAHSCESLVQRVDKLLRSADRSSANARSPQRR